LVGFAAKDCVKIKIAPIFDGAAPIFVGAMKKK
jgi:hypothetical protein